MHNNKLLYYLIARLGLSMSEARARFHALYFERQTHLRHYDLELADSVLNKLGLPECLVTWLDKPL